MLYFDVNLTLHSLYNTHCIPGTIHTADLVLYNTHGTLVQYSLKALYNTHYTPGTIHLADLVLYNKHSILVQ